MADALMQAMPFDILKLLTESTDATIDTKTIIRDVLKWKIGTPHCKG